jgi:hypothetical protein
MWRTSVLAIALIVSTAADADIDRGAWARDLDRAMEELAALQALVDASNDPAVRGQATRRIQTLQRIIGDRLRELRPEESSPLGPPAAGGSLFVESFDDNRQGWTIGNDGLCNATIGEGTLTLSAERSASGKNCRYWWPYRNPLSSFRAEFDVRYNDGPTRFGFGLVLHPIAGRSPYKTVIVTINAEGSAAIFGYDTAWTALSRWQASSGMRLGRAVNRLRIDAAQDQIQLFANGVPAASARVPGVSAEQLGFYLDVSGLEVVFDTLNLGDGTPSAPTWSPPPPAPPPPPPPPPPGPLAPPVNLGAGDELQSLFNALASVPQPGEQKRIALEFASYRNLTTRQVIDVMRRFASPSDQVEIGAGLYPAVIDPGNWYQVYPSMTSPSHAEQLQKWVATIEQRGKPPRRPRGRANATAPMGPAEFAQALQSLNAAYNPQQKMTILRDLTRYNFVRSDQVLQILPGFYSPNDRRSAAVLLWARMIDPENTYLLFAAAPGLQDELVRAYSPPPVR